MRFRRRCVYCQSTGKLLPSVIVGEWRCKDFEGCRKRARTIFLEERAKRMGK